jgi:predicted enzyme involved in methoxymalonyl-ACP biosynthesis
MILGIIDPVNAGILSRITQLTQNPNQLNLITKRDRASDITAILSDPQWGMYRL